MSDTYAFCLNSRRWVIFMDLVGPPRSCTYIGQQGRVSCVGERCGYYEERPPTAYLKQALTILQMWKEE